MAKMCQRLDLFPVFSFKLLSSGRALGVVIYTGRETRSVMNTSHPVSKIGLLDLEVNDQTKILFLLTVALAVTMTVLRVRKFVEATTPEAGATPSQALTEMEVSLSLGQDPLAIYQNDRKCSRAKPSGFCLFCSSYSLIPYG